jgi:hypothetical protein
MKIEGIAYGELVYIFIGLLLLYCIPHQPWIILLYWSLYLPYVFHPSKMTYNLKGERIKPYNKQDKETHDRFSANSYF